MRALMVVNHAATTTSPRTLDVLLSALGHDLELEVAETTHRSHAMELAREARSDRLDAVVVFGGDGTVNEVVNGLLDDASTGAVPDLAVIPGGSTNVLARNLGVPADPVEATGQVLDAARVGRRRSIGLGRLDDRWFTFCAGAGLDADVVREVERRRATGRRSTLPLYVRTAIRRFFAQDHRRRGSMTLERPGVDPVPGIALAVVTNAAPWTYLGSRPVNPTPHANFDSGLGLFALTRLTVPSTLRHLAEVTVAAGRGARGRDVLVLHDQLELTLRSEEPVPVQVDGDYLGERLSMTMRAVPDAISVMA